MTAFRSRWLNRVIGWIAGAASLPCHRRMGRSMPGWPISITGYIAVNRAIVQHLARPQWE